MNKIERALNDEDGDVSELRKNNYNRYYGKQYGNERDGYSKFVTRECFEAVEWALPSVLRAFMSTERAVSFDPVGPDDEAQADQETDVVNYWIQKKNNGFITLHNWTKNILMYPNGYVKAWVEEQDTVEYQAFTGLTMEGLAKIAQHPEMEIIEQDSRQEYFEDYDTYVDLFDIRVKIQKEERALKIESIPPDELLIDDNLYSLDLDEADFICHRTRKSISSLVSQGFDAEALYALGESGDENTWNDERVNRLFYEEENPDSDEAGDNRGPNKLVWVHECYLNVDYDDDNIAEHRRVLMIGDQIFENDPDSYQPFIAASAIIMPHKHIGMSYVESVTDLQLVSTTIFRQMLDNIYKQNIRRHFMAEDALLSDNSTMDDYLDARSELIVINGRPAEQIMPEAVQPFTAELLSVVEYVKSLPAKRTGVAPELSLDPSILKDSTMGAFMGALDQASQRLEMLVRNIAETGMKPLTCKVHQLVRRHLAVEETVKIRGEWITVNPADWNDRTNISVNVGLGFNNKHQKMQLLMGLLDLQKEALGFNLADAEKIHYTLEKLLEVAEMGHSGHYFIDPAKPVGVDPVTGKPIPWQPPQPQPDPNMILAQAQAQALQMEQQRKMFEAQAKAQADNQKLQAEMQKMFASIQEQQARLQIEQDKLLLSREEFQAKYELDVSETAVKNRETIASTGLKEAQTAQTLAQAGKTQLEISDEYREAQDILTGTDNDQTDQ